MSTAQTPARATSSSAAKTDTKEEKDKLKAELKAQLHLRTLKTPILSIVSIPKTI